MLKFKSMRKMRITDAYVSVFSNGNFESVEKNDKVDVLDGIILCDKFCDETYVIEPIIEPMDSGTAVARMRIRKVNE